MSAPKKGDKKLRLHIEKLPEGVFLATSRDVPGLVIQEDTIAKTIESACEMASVLLELSAKRRQKSKAKKFTVAPMVVPTTIPLQVVAG